MGWDVGGQRDATVDAHDASLDARPDSARPDGARPDTGTDIGPDTSRPDVGPVDTGRPDTGPGPVCADQCWTNDECASSCPASPTGALFCCSSNAGGRDPSRSGVCYVHAPGPGDPAGCPSAGGGGDPGDGGFPFPFPDGGSCLLSPCTTAADCACPGTWSCFFGVCVGG